MTKLKRHIGILLFNVSLILPTLSFATVDQEISELIAFSKAAIQENKIPMALVVAREALEITPENNEAKLIVKKAEDILGHQNIRGSEYRIWLIRGALEAHDKGQLYATKAMLSRLLELEPDNNRVQKLHKNVIAKIEKESAAAFEISQIKTVPLPQANPVPVPETQYKDLPINPKTMTVTHQPLPEIAPRIEEAPPAPPPVIPYVPHPTAHNKIPQVNYHEYQQRHDQSYQNYPPDSSNNVTGIENLHLQDPKIAFISQWRDQLIVDTVIERGSNSLLKIGKRLYHPGDLVLKDQQVFLHSISPAQRTISFYDPSGNVYNKRY